MNHVIDLLTKASMKSEVENGNQNVCFEVYDDRMGFIPIVYDSKQKIIAKTLIPPELMGYISIIKNIKPLWVQIILRS